MYDVVDENELDSKKSKHSPGIDKGKCKGLTDYMR